MYITSRAVCATFSSYSEPKPHKIPGAFGAADSAFIVFQPSYIASDANPQKISGFVLSMHTHRATMACLAPHGIPEARVLQEAQCEYPLLRARSQNESDVETRYCTRAKLDPQLALLCSPHNSSL